MQVSNRQAAATLRAQALCWRSLPPPRPFRPQRAAPQVVIVDRNQPAEPASDPVRVALPAAAGRSVRRLSLAKEESARRVLALPVQDPAAPQIMFNPRSPVSSRPLGAAQAARQTSFRSQERFLSHLRRA